MLFFILGFVISFSDKAFTPFGNPACSAAVNPSESFPPPCCPPPEPPDSCPPELDSPPGVPSPSNVTSPSLFTFQLFPVAVYVTVNGKDSASSCSAPGILAVTFDFNLSKSTFPFLLILP